MTTPIRVTFGENTYDATALDPATWNGFVVPLFTTEQAQAILPDLQPEEGSDSHLEYDADRDVFVLVDTYDPDCTERIDADVVEHDGVRLHAVGAFSWTWSVVGRVHREFSSQAGVQAWVA